MADTDKKFNITPEEILEKYPPLVIPVQGLQKIDVTSRDSVIVSRNAHHAFCSLTQSDNSKMATWYDLRTLRYCDEGSWTVSLPSLDCVVSADLIDSLIDSLMVARAHIIGHRKTTQKTP